MRVFPEHPQKQLPLQKSAVPLRFLKSPPEQATSNEIWLLTLSDLLMLLMIFFVFLLAAPLVKTVKDTPSPSETAKVATTTAVNIENVVMPSINSSADSRNQQTVSSLENDLQNLLGREGDRQGVTVQRRSQFIVITFPEQILFDSGQAQMKTDAAPSLAKVAYFIIGHPEISVEVQGHTDDLPINSRRYPSNWELSADRATQVAKTLVELGTDPRQIATKGFGEYHPVAPNTSDEDRMKNRRVEIQFSMSRS